MDTEIQKLHVVPQFTMLKEDVHCLPEGVIQDLDQLLMHETVVRRRLQVKDPCEPGNAKVMALRCCAAASAAAT